MEVDSVLDLVAAARGGRAHLFLFDELFRGTNAVERIAAGEAVLWTLLEPPASQASPAHVVIAATHDQELVELLAGRYTLLEQAPLHDLFPAVKKHGASIVVGGPFNSGVLVGGKTFNYAKAPPEVVKQVKRIGAICDAHRVPLAAAAARISM